MILTYFCLSCVVALLYGMVRLIGRMEDLCDKVQWAKTRADLLVDDVKILKLEVKSLQEKVENL